jgi:hypothetical protein
MTFGSSGLFFSSCGKKSLEGMIIFTQVSGNQHDVNYITGDSWRLIPESRIVALNPGKSDKSLKFLTEGYLSARSPEISYDGESMLFAAQKTQNDPWQIWEMNLKNLKARQITHSDKNCIDPAYLPGGRVVFSKFTINDTVKSVHSLFTCNIDGSEVRQITFSPNTYFASTVMQDGRLLAISRQLYPDQRDCMLAVLRPDGTKEDMFYHGAKGTDLYSRGWETNNGKIVFIESDESNHEGGKLISINYNRPLHSRVDMSSDINGDFYAISPLQSGKLLVTYRPSENERYALYEFDPENRTLGQVIYKNSDYNVLEAVEVNIHDRPKKLPSEVDMGVKTGLLLCQNINFPEILPGGNTSSTSKAVKIEVMGIDSSLGIVNVEKDGSFFLKVLADTPFQIRTIDENGKVLNGPCSWIYLRPNERRGCVGCHEDHEQVPQNRQPLSVLKAPVIIPVHINKIVEKQVELE